MGDEAEEPTSFGRWISRPQSLIALAALLMSICGLFVALYEASLVRRQQRASVWPYVEVAASLTRERVEVRVRNTGVGPARIEAAAVTRDGEVLKGWADLIATTAADSEESEYYYSLIHGSVLRRDSEAVVIFRVTSDQESVSADLVPTLAKEMLAGRADVTVCYCSVFDECWVSSLRGVFRSSSDGEAAGERAVESCEGAPRSRI